MTRITSDNPDGGTEFIVASEIMRKFMAMAQRVACHMGTVLVIGETGTGKETIAHTIHEHSLRCSKPFVAINCAALPEHLVESELFGYEKGAFSGADVAKPGLFEMANTGTIFLDEIGELDLKVQVKLLRVLDRAPYYRLGGHRKIITDVRVVAATNRNLKEEVRAGRFRKDLYHRLNQFELCVPPLRDRPEDIVALAEHFLAQYGEGLKFSCDALRVLQAYAWPGNVRELQNVVNKVMVLAQGSEIGAPEVRQELREDDEDDGIETDQLTSSALQVGSVEAEEIKKALEKTGGHRGEAAKTLGISRRTLSRRLREYGFASTRRTAQSPLGSIGYQQQRDLRVPVRIPMTLQTEDGREFICTAVDLSAGGVGVEGLNGILDQQCKMIVRFQLPDFDVPFEVAARLAWADNTQGRAGIFFTDVTPAVRQEILQWLRQQMVSEGWNIQPEPAEPLAVLPGPTWANVAQ
jgi:transcriptional regulator with AAA-type ATPase domain